MHTIDNKLSFTEKSYHSSKASSKICRRSFKLNMFACFSLEGKIKLKFF